MYYDIVYMNFYFNISMNSTHAKKYSTLMCFYPSARLKTLKVSSKSYNNAQKPKW